MVKNDMLVNKNANVKIGEYVQRRACTLWSEREKHFHKWVSFCVDDSQPHGTMLTVCSIGYAKP